ncbi:phosphatidylserine decarboxylase family protein [Paucihalobacter sp.]|uniref:phosphatidylserine decarboxylase family protein n=1 Tax=Paucihalobacter sp. TaxID=2850405 RepID=UPI002FDF1928
MFHKEGQKIIFVSLVIVILLIFLIDYFVLLNWLRTSLMLIVIVFFILILQFFRNPNRNTKPHQNHVLCPVDGKVVVIEEVFETEFLKEKCIQVSVFMSPLNVHVTRYPVSGDIIFSKYHPGKYLVAWHPKASEENERTTVVIKNERFGKVLYRQIAGAMARRIVNYAVEKDKVIQGADSGFIKFGSRVDVFLPLHSKIEVKLNDKVKGGETILATIE